MTKRRKHVPTRTCVGCRETAPKRELVRIVRSPDGVKVDFTGKLTGRGAYVHRSRKCWEAALKGHLRKALRTELTDEERESLTDFGDELSYDLSERK